ncbi:class I SAM-dependent methyltransferase [Mobilitalea sibirica]|uniref:Class I SAM-dependent methyltransferase n=1 Tax=Mobilitalea sibirica TaxID=1462919 RepID=A0A8J7H4B5_9FIRM|nr:class I SAM-dependent methyltransferase [Mobilitalea sibirica]MBH1942135.1 class I SAM-dependent methyltransferase [Mobilitalea sibirica]
MNELLLHYLSQKPEFYAPSTSKFWDDEHISKGMLEAHLNPDWEPATRKHTYVRSSVDWISDITKHMENKALLDLGCGPGIYAELFTEKGFQVTGVDLSSRSIQYAKQSSSSKRLQINYHCQNYLDIVYNNEFDVVTLIYHDFGVLAPQDREKLLLKIQKALKPGGLFIVDTLSMKYYEGIKETTSWNYSDSGFWSNRPHACISSVYRYDKSSSYVDQYIIIEKDCINCYNIWNHAFTTEELRNDLYGAGFQTVDFFGGVAGEAYSDAGQTICAVARK